VDETVGGTVTTVERSRVTPTEAAEIMPFGGWETTPAATRFGGQEALFRFPAPDDPAPGTARLLTLSLYTAVLGLSGVTAAICGLVTAIAGAPFWFMPAIALLAMTSVAGTVAAYLAIHRPVLSWLLLIAATIPMVSATALATLY
jgi:hypothetical protein